MRYLRTLSNSLVAATLGTAYLLAVILQMNPTVPLDRTSLAPLVGALPPDADPVNERESLEVALASIAAAGVA